MAESNKTTPGKALTPGENAIPARRRLKLGSVADCRATLARFVRLYDGGEVSEAHFRTVTYGLNSILGFLKTEKDLEIESRLDRLEERAGIQ